MKVSNSRVRVLDCALGLLRSGGTVSLDSVAQRVGMTKAGVMHYFRSKEALMLALVDLVGERWEQELAARLPVALAESSAQDRIRAYLDWALSGSFDEADLVMIADPRLRKQLTARWQERMNPWIVLPADLSDDERTRLTAVRLLAEGAWLTDAFDADPLSAHERDQVRMLAEDLLEGGNDRAREGVR